MSFGCENSPAAMPHTYPEELLAGSLLWSSTMPAFGSNFFVKRQRIVSFLLSPRPLLSHDEMKRFLDSGGSIDKRDGALLPRSSSASRVNSANLSDFSVKQHASTLTLVLSRSLLTIHHRLRKATQCTSLSCSRSTPKFQISSSSSVSAVALRAKCFW